MTKRILPALLLVVVCSLAFFSCKKSSNSATGDITKAYFPLKFGKYVTYNVDSTYFTGSNCKTSEKIAQLRYSVSDTFRDNNLRLSYIMDIQYRANATAAWTAQGVIYVTNTGGSIEYVQGGIRTIKMVFPVAAGQTWLGNSLVNVNDSAYTYLNNWIFSYQNVDQGYNTSYESFGNTVTVLENDETINNLGSNDATVPYTFRSYSKAIYAFDIGMVYSEKTYQKYDAKVGKCLSGTTVIMQAIDHN